MGVNKRSVLRAEKRAVNCRVRGEFYVAEYKFLPLSGERSLLGSCEDRLRESGFYSLEKGKLQSHLTAPFQHLKGDIKKRRVTFLHRQIVIGQGGMILN